MNFATLARTLSFLIVCIVVFRARAVPVLSHKSESREALARLKILLARYGGVEFSVYTSDDQLTLNPYLELFIYARTDRWLYLLEGKGLEEQSRVHTKSWKTNRQHFPAAPDLVNAVTAGAERLGLQPA